MLRTPSAASRALMLAALTLSGAAALAVAPSEAHAQPAEVEIVNPPYAPGHVISPADSMPFVETVTVKLVAGAAWNLEPFTVVPAGYRLIIDHVAVSIIAPPGQRAWAMFRPCTNNKPGLWGFTRS